MKVAFDPSRAPEGASEIWLQSTMLHWEHLGCDPRVIVENSARIKGRFEPSDDLNGEPVAVIAFGPSLKETWEQTRDFKVRITCSGAHKFLLQRGIAPTYHVESDPRIHKVDMLGDICPETIYLPASICHPRYLDRLYEPNIRLWHLFFDDPAVYRLVPKGEWLLTGGNTVGPRAIKIARLMGYTNLHMFGFDGSGRHADEHGNPPPDWKYKEVGFNGKRYLTTNNLIDHVTLLFRDLDTIPDARFTFHGEGLIQDVAKHWKHRYIAGYPLAVVKDD